MYLVETLKWFEMEIENPKKEDAKELAYLINLAGEGIPEYLWSGMVEGSESPLDVGTKRASREEGGFSYRNARVIKNDGGVVGMIISYKLDDPYEIGDLAEYPEVVRPLIELEAKAPGSWYINAIATSENYRGRGIAKRLLEEAELRAKEQGVDVLSLIVASNNIVARDLYIKLGYELKFSLPVVEYPNSTHSGDWQLLIKHLGPV